MDSEAGTQNSTYEPMEVHYIHPTTTMVKGIIKPDKITVKVIRKPNVLPILRRYMLAFPRKAKTK